MKGFIVVDRINDIQFLDTDKEFAKHINEQAKESGLLPEDYSDIFALDPNVVMQQFSPLFMSQWFLIDQAKNPCSSITCENGLLYVFKHFEDFLIISINGDGTESEDFLTRKNLVFIRLIGFVNGPVIDQIKNPKFKSRAEKWKYLQTLMATWVYLSNNEQAFLVEAVERLHVNQLVNEQCFEVLQAAIAVVQEAGERNTQHALLFVNTKLLAMYSNRNAHELIAADILCITLLVRALFPSNEKLEDLFAHSYKDSANRSQGTTSMSSAAGKTQGGSNGERERFESAFEGTTTGDEEDEDDTKYHSCVDNPSNGRSSSRRKPSSTPETTILTEALEDEDTAVYPEVSETYFTPTMSPVFVDPSKLHGGSSRSQSDTPNKLDQASRKRSHTTGELGSTSQVRGQGEETFGRGRSRSLNEPTKEPFKFQSHSSSDTVKQETIQQPQEPALREEDMEYIKQPVFLNTPLCRFSPFQMHCRRIYPGIMMVILTEMPKLSQANRLVQILQLLKDMINGNRDTVSRNQGQLIYDVINTHIIKILSVLKKGKGKLEASCGDIKKKWDNDAMKIGMLQYLEQGHRTEISPSLERSLKALYSKLMELFLCLYLTPRQTTPQMTAAMGKIRNMVIKQLGDYKDYLAVKAQRNITMTSYIERFPGLIHFIYVNRRTNQVMAPSLNITHDDDNTTKDATQLLKEKIWSMSSWVQQKLHEGYTSVSTREGDFQYSYFLWFEDCTGNPEVIHKPYRADPTAPPPGILTGNFYKYLTHKCFPNAVQNTIHCNELFMMHVGLAPSQFIANQCRELASLLWDSSGEIYQSMNLL